MLEFLIHTVLPTIGTITLGAVGWFVTHFVAAPILDFYKIRRGVHEEMFFTKNVAPGYMPEEKVQEAIAAMRRLAARLDALRVSLHSVPRDFLSFRGYDLASAAQGLTGLSNSFGMEDGSLALHRNQVQTALKLDRDYTDQQIAEIDRARRQRA